MKPIKIVIGILAVLVLALGAVVALLLLSVTPEDIIADESPAVFAVVEVGTASDNAYAVFNYRGEGELTVHGLDSQPHKKVVIVDDNQAIQASRFDELVDELTVLEDYGYRVLVSNRTTIGEGIYVIPTGAIPAYVLFNLQQNTSNATIIYVGETDLILSRGIKQQAWYENLLPGQRDRIVLYEGTLDELMAEYNTSMSDDILHVAWDSNESKTVKLDEGGLDTVVVPLEDEGYMRIVYTVDDLQGIYDSPRLKTARQFVDPDPNDMYPWQTSTLLFALNKTNGTAFLSIDKDGKEILRELLRRVSDENVFLEKLNYEEPGEYIITVEDNSGVIATGLLHVYDLDIKLAERSGMVYTFDVIVDGEPVKSADAYVRLGESTEGRRYYVNNGKMTLTAKLEQGLSTFNVDIFGTTIPVEYDNRRENLFDFYLKYGAPGLLLILAVYFGARISRRPTYRLRFGDTATFVRQEMRIPVERAIESFRKIRSDMNIGRVPITPHEFTVSLKRYLTNGADITEGNVEEILKNLVKAGRLEGYREYYQMRGEGDIKRNTLRRMIREKLIQNGTMFTERDGKFVTESYEIGFYGQKFNKKGFIVVEDKSEARRILSNLSDADSARLRLMRANDMVELVPIDRLEDVL